MENLTAIVSPGPWRDDAVRLECPEMTRIQRVEPEDRARLNRLLDTRSAADAMAAYYALQYPTGRVTILGAFSGERDPRAFLIIAQTGLDLFRPLVVPFVAKKAFLMDLLAAGLGDGRPVLLYLPVEQQEWVRDLVELNDERVTELLRLDPLAFEPIINLFVVSVETPTGWPRYEIRSGKVIHAASGLNWKGEHFAEVYVQAEGPALARGFVKSVLASIAGKLLGEKLTALLRVDEEDRFTRAEALSIGFRPTGVRTLIAQARWTPVGS